MERVTELAIAPSSFFGGLTRPCAQSAPSVRIGDGARPEFAALGAATSRSRRVVVGGVRKSGGFGGGRGRGDGAAAEVCRAEAGSASTPSGGSVRDDYGLSDPQAVSQTSLFGGTGGEILQKLKHGFVKFKEERFLKESDLFSQLAAAQQPKVMVIACADSRVCPTMLMGLDPGEVFTVRNVANLVPPYEKKKATIHGTSAALEFAVKALKVEHIIVIGHRNCGGIRALMTRERDEIESDFIGRWMTCAMPARDSALEKMQGRSFDDQCKYCEREAINGSLGNLLTFPWIKESFDAGKLNLHGWYYDFVEGDLICWEVDHSERSLEETLVAA